MMGEAIVEGVWDCVTETPMGEQRSVFTVIREGDRFSGTNSAEIGTVDIEDGRIDGTQISWKMSVTRPMSITLVGKATIDGDQLAGKVVAGIFGSGRMTGTRRA